MKTSVKSHKKPIPSVVLELYKVSDQISPIQRTLSWDDISPYDNKFGKKIPFRIRNTLNFEKDFSGEVSNWFYFLLTTLTSRGYLLFSHSRSMSHGRQPHHDNQDS